jgi:tyrosine-protein kinase Etk/Wzc
VEKNIVENKKNVPVDIGGEEEIDIVELLRVIWKNKKMIIVITTVVVILSVAVALLTKRSYESELTFTAETQKDSVGGLAALASSLPLASFGLGAGSGNLENYKIIMESRTFREELINKKGLFQYYITSQKIDLSKIKDKEKMPDIMDAAKWLGKIVTVSKDEKTGVFTIKAEIGDKKTAALLPQYYYDELQFYLKEKKVSKSKMNRIYIEKQLEIVNNKMVEQEEEIKRIGKKYNSVSVGDEAKAIAEIMAEIKKGIMEKTNQITVMKEFAGSENSELKKNEKELEVYKKQLKNLQTGGKNVPVDIIPLNDIPTLKIKIERLTRELQATAELYKMLLVQAGSARIEEVKDIPVTNILDKSVEPKIPSKPNRKLMVVIGMVLGLFLGIFAAFAKEFLKGIDFKKITE